MCLPLQMSPLGYREADVFHLFRSEEGIVMDEEGSFVGLLNYPATVQISKRAIQKMDLEYKDNYNSSTVEVYGVLKSGRKISLFTVNSNFFGRVQLFPGKDLPSADFDVAVFEFDSRTKAFEANSQAERSVSTLEWAEDKKDVVTSFGAQYKLGYGIASEIHEFASQFFPDSTFPEKIILKMDVDNSDRWKLTLCQRQSEL